MREKKHRTRDIAVTTRMTKYEFEILKKRVEDSGLTQQEFIIRAIIGAPITTAEEIETEKEVSRTFADLVRQLRGLATNVNQMAHIANATYSLPTIDTLDEIGKELNHFRKESEDIWQSIRSSITRPSPMER